MTVTLDKARDLQPLFRAILVCQGDTRIRKRSLGVKRAQVDIGNLILGMPSAMKRKGVKLPWRRELQPSKYPPARTLFALKICASSFHAIQGDSVRIRHPPIRAIYAPQDGQASEVPRIACPAPRVNTRNNEGQSVRTAQAAFFSHRQGPAALSVKSVPWGTHKAGPHPRLRAVISNGRIPNNAAGSSTSTTPMRMERAGGAYLVLKEGRVRETRFGNPLKRLIVVMVSSTMCRRSSPRCLDFGESRQRIVQTTGLTYLRSV